jgi:hypothetical protein
MQSTTQQYMLFEQGRVALKRDGKENVIVYIFQDNLGRLAAGEEIYADYEDRKRPNFIQQSLPFQSLKVRDTGYEDTYAPKEKGKGFEPCRTRGRYAGSIKIQSKS